MPDRYTVHLICHTHWDREWYLPRAAFAVRLAGAVDAVLDLLAADPATRFTLDGQTILLDDVVALVPRQRGRLEAAVRSGQLEIGPWYVLADELIPSGESLIRNLLAGMHDSATYGRPMPVLYSPDAFGHPAALPLIAREFGIAHAVVWRGLALDGADRDFYRWHGPGATDLLVYHLPPQGYEFGMDLVTSPGLLAERWRTLRLQLTLRATTDQIAVFIGADHHAPVRDPLALRSALEQVDHSSKFVISTLAEFMTAAASARPDAPPRRGELRSYGHTWALQGVHGTRARLKRRHGAVELLLQRHTEPLAALTALHTGLDLRDPLLHTARTLLACQFHDTLGGCSSDPVAAEQSVRLTSVAVASQELAMLAVNALSGNDPDAARDTPAHASPTLMLWNPAVRPRGGIAVASVTGFLRDVLVGPPGTRQPHVGPGYQARALRTAAGDPVPVQILSRHVGLERLDAAHHYPDQDEVEVVQLAFPVGLVPALGIAAFSPDLVAVEPPATDLEVSERQLANRHLELHVTDHGVVDLIDRRLGERYADICQLVDESDTGDSYTPFVTGGQVAKRWTMVSRDVVADGPFLSVLAVRYTLHDDHRGSLDARLTFFLFADSPALRIRLEVENHRGDHRLRLRIPVGAGTTAVAGAAFGTEARQPMAVNPADYPTEAPLATAPAQRYVGAAHGERGMVLLCPGFFEYEWNDGRELLMTVFRSTGELSRADIPARPGHAGWPAPIPEAQEHGIHRLEFTVMPVTENELTRSDFLEAAWEDVFLPWRPTWLRQFTGDITHLAGIGLELSGAGLVFTACKPRDSDDGIIVRCVNMTDHEVPGEWTSAVRLSAAQWLRADESLVDTMAIRDGRRVAFIAAPRGLVTIGLTVARSATPD